VLRGKRCLLLLPWLGVALAVALATSLDVAAGGANAVAAAAAAAAAAVVVVVIAAVAAAAAVGGSEAVVLFEVVAWASWSDWFEPSVRECVVVLCCCWWLRN